MIEQMISAGKLKGRVRSLSDKQHAWAVFESGQTGKTYVLDVAQGQVGVSSGRQYHGSQAVWDQASGRMVETAGRFSYDQSSRPRVQRLRAEQRRLEPTIESGQGTQADNLRWIAIESELRATSYDTTGNN